MTSTPNAINNLPVVLFEHQQAWADWLDKNHATSAGVWIRLAKKAAGLKSVSYDEAKVVSLVDLTTP